MSTKCFTAVLFLFIASPCIANEKLPFADVRCMGDYQHHLQGVCTNEKDAVYWSFTTELVKTDRHGKVLKKIPVTNHHGDLCFHQGKIYVAVNLGSFNDPKGNADSWVYVYDAETLKLTVKHETQEVFHGAGGIGVMSGRFYVVGGLPDGVQENYVYEYDEKFKFIKKHIIKSGWTRLGIQAATFHDGAWWFGCYGSPAILLKTDAQFKMLGRYEFDCSLGIVGVVKDRLLVAKGPRTEQGRWLGSLHLAHPDKKRGLMFLPQTTPCAGVQPLDALQARTAAKAWTPASIQRQGNWSDERFRFAAFAAARTTEEKASLEYAFQGTGVSIRLGGHNVPAYGEPNLGKLAVLVDGKPTQVLRPRSLPREIVLAQGLKPGSHTVRVEHHQDEGEAGARIESFTVWDDARGDLQFQINGEANSHLVDCRAILRHSDTIIRNALVRNWLTGQASLTGLPPGDDYSLEIRAVGWRTVRTAPFGIVAGKSTKLPPIFLKRDASTVTSRPSRFRFPRLNKLAIRKPGETFRARFLGFDATIDEVKLTRSLALLSRAENGRRGSVLESQTTTISRVLKFEEDKPAAYYYDREVVAALPDDMPPGVYDLQVQVTGGRRTGVCRSPRSVHVLSNYPTNPTFVTFGHLDTSGQYQAEYLQRLVDVINLLAPDMVLCSNACNPAYVSGALAGLDMPYMINFGNHQFIGHEDWYGDPIGLIDLGPNISILNYGYPWHVEKSKPQAETLLASRPNAAIKIINAFEANAPLELLDRHQVRMIHDAHGIGKKVTDFGKTPTRRIGKSNSESFRVVRFQNNRVTSCTYNGHETAPIPFGRESPLPVSVRFQHPNDGSCERNVATIRNRLVEAYPNGRVTFIVPAGKYHVRGGRLESQTASDDGHYHVLTIRVDIPADDSTQVVVERM